MDTATFHVLQLSGSTLEPLGLAIADAIMIREPLAGATRIALCRKVHARRPELPLLVLAGQLTVEEKVTLFEAGADEVLLEPVDPRELEARLKAILRRRAAGNAPPSVRFGDMQVDLQRGRLYKQGRQIPIPAKEFLLLRQLIQHRGVTLSRVELLREVWGSQSVLTRTVDVHIAMLRQRLEDHPQRPRFIHTVRGKGYQFRAAREERVPDC